MKTIWKYVPALLLALPLLAWAPAPESPAGEMEWADLGCNDDRDGCGWFSGFKGWDEDHVLPSVDVFSTPGAWWGVHNDCMLCAVGNCGHDTCNMVEEEDVDDFEMSMTVEDFETAADLYAAFESKGAAGINHERGVVQLLDCSGGVYAQFAVSEAVAALMLQRAAQD